MAFPLRPDLFIAGKQGRREGSRQNNKGVGRLKQESFPLAGKVYTRVVVLISACPTSRIKGRSPGFASNDAVLSWRFAGSRHPVPSELPKCSYARAWQSYFPPHQKDKRRRHKNAWRALRVYKVGTCHLPRRRGGIAFRCTACHSLAPTPPALLYPQVVGEKYTVSSWLFGHANNDCLVLA